MSARRRLAESASVAELHGEAVVLHLASGRYFSANGTGAALLRRLCATGGATPDELAHALVETHGIPADRARADVDAWLARLDAAKLLAPVDGASPAPR